MVPVFFGITNRIQDTRNTDHSLEPHSNFGSTGQPNNPHVFAQDFVANLKHGTNLLLNGAKEFPPWADVRAEHAERGHEWMEKFSVDDIWKHHCVVPYVPVAHKFPPTIGMVSILYIYIYIDKYYIYICVYIYINR